jgi:hypothetical protein
VEGERGVEQNSAAMTDRGRTQRTERILVARLEELACVLERTGAPHEVISRMLESASVATMNAVALNLISADIATDIWRDAEAKHPEIAPLRRAA